MQNGGSNFTDYESVNQFLVSLNGTIQAPTDSFTVSGSTLTFASNLSTGDVIDFIMVFGNSLSAGTPTDATVSTAKIVDSNVTTAKLADDSVTAAKINDDIISGATELATAPADTDEFLVSDAGTLKRIDYSLIKGGGITQASSWRLTTNFNGGSNPISSNWEEVDTQYARIGSAFSQSSGIFTFPETGIYLIMFQTSSQFSGTYGYHEALIIGSTDNFSSSTNLSSSSNAGTNGSRTQYRANLATYIFDVVNTSTHKVSFRIATDESVTTRGDTNTTLTGVTFIRLGDT
jgi:hypothetical protein